METRIAKFIAALRASGVRVSVAESQDAWQAITYLGSKDRASFKLSLQATLVKDAESTPIFEELFSQYFNATAPSLVNPQGELSADDQQLLQQAMQQLSADLQQLLEWLLNGDDPSKDALEDLAEQTGLNQGDPSMPYRARRIQRRMQQLLNWDRLQDFLEALWEALAEQGMDPASLEQLKAKVTENQQRLAEQLEAFVDERIREQLVEQARHRNPVDDLMQRSFTSLQSSEMDLLRDQVRRLSARLRTRASLRQKRGKKGKLDPKATIRANLRYSGVPFEMHYKQRRLKPKLVTILDVSTSMRPVAEFFLRMLYELQDQVQKTRSFAFIDHLEDVTPDLSGVEIDRAVYSVLTKLPSGHYNTDLGYSLQQFEKTYLDTVDSRTTVIVLGDGRNNFNAPGLSSFKRISLRSRKLIWMNPEYPAQWGTGDSDMLDYAPLCSDVYQVRNLAQLTDAIDHIFM